MRKLVRPSYTAEVNLIILLCIFLVACFCSYELFDVRFHNREHLENAYPGIALIGVAVVLMVLIVWEEILFQIKVKEVKGGLVFRNRRRKVRTQILLFSAIPAIFTFIYFEYDVKMSHFVVWAVVCIVIPAIDIVVSGINNYNKYLELTNRIIKFQNNKKDGCFNTADLKNIMIIKDDRRVMNKIQLLFRNNDNVTIDLDEMNLDAFYDSIYSFIKTNYKHLLIEPQANQVVVN